ncbi:MAG: DUF2029 domain-containing protein, partial [Deltaproteobacteria bacterium]|nr:DUF2029 domain-containing protein [Deltaproteobacteria bacterium]
MEARTALAEASLLAESGVRFLAAYRFWIVAAVWVGVRAYAVWGLQPDYFVARYFEMAGDWLDGFTPYAAFKVEYPPGALVLMVLPRIFTEAPIVYGYLFAFMMLLADLAILLCLDRMAALVFGSQIHGDTVRRYKSTLLGLIYVLFTAFFGRLLFQHDDLIVALLLTAVIYAALRKKTAVVDVLLAVGIWLNLTALVWLPLLWWYGFVGRDEPLSSKRILKISEFMRALLPRVAVLAGSLAVLFLPFILLAGRSLAYMVQFHLARGTQLESTAAGILMMAAKIFGVELSTEFTHHSMHLSGELGSQGAVVSAILSIIVFVVLTIYLARRMYDQREASARDGLLIRGLPAVILALLATSKVFMPQYLVWIAPLAALLALDDHPRYREVGWRLFAVNLLSVVLFYFYYPDLRELHFLPGVLLLVRNVLVIWSVISLLVPDKPAAERREPVWHIPARVRKYLTYVPVVLVFA